jgi:hypothetical protein
VVRSVQIVIEHPVLGGMAARLSIDGAGLLVGVPTQ